MLPICHIYQYGSDVIAVSFNDGRQEIFNKSGSMLEVYPLS